MTYTYYTVGTPGAIPVAGLETIENFDALRNVGHCITWARVTVYYGIA